MPVLMDFESGCRRFDSCRAYQVNIEIGNVRQAIRVDASCDMRGAGERLPCDSGEIPEGAGPLWGAHQGDGARFDSCRAYHFNFAFANLVVLSS